VVSAFFQRVLIATSKAASSRRVKFGENPADYGGRFGGVPGESGLCEKPYRA
jgi:hypothetical protein